MMGGNKMNDGTERKACCAAVAGWWTVIIPPARALLSLIVLGLSATLASAAAGEPTTTPKATPEAGRPNTQAEVAKEAPLRFLDPVKTVVADLKAYAPDRMRQAGVPGLAIALIRDNHVVWSEGFGLANKITRRPVMPDTVFEAASISKVVTAYTALRLVERGKLALDEPLSARLSKPWLPPSDKADRITLRHLASHSSGLTENVFPTIDKSVIAAPGSRFLYTGIGFMYMQEAIEQVTGQSLEAAAREVVFEPLGMASSSFVNKPEHMPRMANGHMRPTLPLLAFLIPFAFLLAGFALVAVPVARFVTGKWRLSRRLTASAALLAGFLTLILLALSSLNGLPNFLLLIALCAGAFAVLFAPALLLGGRILAALPAAAQGQKMRALLGTVWVALTLVALVVVSARITIPIPRSPSPAPSAVGSLRTTVGDLATFLIELVEPRYLSGEMAARIATPQIPAGEGFSWGLGIGIQDSAQGDALWQNAQTFGYRGLMVIYPEHGWGVVVLTNSDDGYPVACDVAQRALGGKARWEHF
jgi:CubicO group peptidase (beta-lactamase class C family)